MSLLIGCPVADRSWILPTWYEYVKRSCEYAGTDFNLVFMTSKDDDVTRKLVQSFDETVLELSDDEDAQPQDHRWDDTRYHRMVALRNGLLAGVRRLAPDFFLSLDSDILIHEELVSNLIETLTTRDCVAVGGKTFMTTSDNATASYAVFRSNGNWDRHDTVSVHTVDAIMAIKLMSPEAYNVDYVYDRQGEDLGWSKSVTASGESLWFDGRVGCKHVMIREQLEKLDARVGF